jgi:hypothetical protein
MLIYCLDLPTSKQVNYYSQTVEADQVTTSPTNQKQQSNIEYERSRPEH